MIPNLVQVDNRVWRGGRPQPSDYPLNFSSILNLEGSDVAGAEYQKLEGQNFLWFPITPLEIYGGGFNGALIPNAVDFISKAPVAVFVHCEHGQDRTGLIIAAYRISTGWTWDAAYAEALQHGYRKDIDLGLDRLMEGLK